MIEPRTRLLLHAWDWSRWVLLLKQPALFQGLSHMGMCWIIYINQFAVYIQSPAVGRYHAEDDLYERIITRSIIAH